MKNPTNEIPISEAVRTLFYEWAAQLRVDLRVDAMKREVANNAK
jgi:hypothetical protein